MIQQIYWQRSLKIQNYINIGCLFIVNEDYSLDTRLLFPWYIQYSPLEKGDGKELKSGIQAMKGITPQNCVTYVFLNGSDLVAHGWKCSIEMSVVLAQIKMYEYNDKWALKLRIFKPVLKIWYSFFKKVSYI